MSDTTFTDHRGRTDTCRAHHHRTLLHVLGNPLSDEDTGAVTEICTRCSRLDIVLSRDARTPRIGPVITPPLVDLLVDKWLDLTLATPTGVKVRS